VAPIFFLLLFGVIEAGRFILYYETLNNATREGARYAIVHGSNSNCPSGPMPPGQTAPLACYDPSGAKVVQQVESAAFGLLGSAVAVTPQWAPTGNGRDSDVAVRATYTYRPLLGLVPLPPITMQAESRLVINN
jgi:Flp pilus assembly protein TadG